jgi:hypothetical protein
MTDEMHVVASKYVSRAHALWSLAENSYAGASATASYWMMIDLRRSAAYREVAGSERGYCRAEVFAGTVRELTDRYSSIDLFKELGDGLLLKGSNLRDMVEVVCILDAIRRAWGAGDARRNAPDFNFSCAITHGECMALVRDGVTDYLGSPIDHVARISGFRPQSEDLLLVLEATTADIAGRDVLTELDFLQLDSAESLPVELQKENERPIRVRRLRINRSLFDSSRRFFSRLRT